MASERQLRMNIAIVNISDTRQYYQPQPGLKSHWFKFLISFTGCCACCSVVTVICVCLLVYQDYAATFTGVGNQQMFELLLQTKHVFIWSVLVGPLWTKLHHRIKKNGSLLAGDATVSLKERRRCLVLS